MRVQRLLDASADADVSAVVALEAESFTNPWSRETLVWELRNSDVTRVYLLRAEDERILGFCVCWLIFDELHINTVAIAGDARRKGLATFLLRHVIAEAAQVGVRKATLEVRASNAAALALYRRLGFSVAATRPGYYSKPEEDGLILWREGIDASP